MRKTKNKNSQTKTIDRTESERSESVSVGKDGLAKSCTGITS